ncbi:MAG: hypothetical protein CVT73_04445 [Alphaproteobacteria bacterium HGW-Alphaproteobacteria-12]|nr:MAG: hypothetical protein CVT73_04445 [Alphaproteobacteria bacterium HGW-Alphaproteobacteria-12]
MTETNGGRTALVAGASGLVGGLLLKRLLAAPQYERVLAVTRRDLGTGHQKLRQITANFDRLDTALAGIGAVDDAFCTLGTTIRKAGSEAEFRKVDHDYILAFGQAAKQAGAERFLLISAVGANARSRVFYSRVKGETEEALTALGFPALDIFQPGLLLGARSERRPTEAAFIALMPLINPLLLGPAKIYRGISADALAAAMIEAAKAPPAGLHRHTYASMISLAARA